MTVTYPSKQEVRDYLGRRIKAVTPPPTPEEIRQELGWAMIEDERVASASILDK